MNEVGPFSAEVSLWVLCSAGIQDMLLRTSQKNPEATACQSRLRDKIRRPQPDICGPVLFDFASPWKGYVAALFILAVRPHSPDS